MAALPKRTRKLTKTEARSDQDSLNKFTCVVIGGGIAGVSCAQELSRLHAVDGHTVALISATEAIKEVGIDRVGISISMQ
jgi:2-polyprenyl-6-methoxyphenol hydroxylase-like FAD-dependent oxidoreductase